MTAPRPYKTHIGQHALHPETQMLNYGYDPELSEGAVKPPVFLTSTFVFKTAEEGRDFFDFVSGRREPPAGTEAGLVYSRFNQPNSEIVEDRLAVYERTESGVLFSSGMSAIATTLLTFVRPGDVIHSLRMLTMKSGPQFMKLDVNGAIQEVLALTRSDLQRHSVALHTDLSAHLHPVMADRVQVQQVLLNLITNAMDAMADVTDRSKVLAIRAKPAQPDGVLVAVEDTGAGIDPAKADQIFAPFYTTKSSGMGMGLSICKTIIEVHGGQLWAKPNMPHGAIFQFRLPADGRDVS